MMIIAMVMLKIMASGHRKTADLKLVVIYVADIQN